MRRQFSEEHKKRLSAALRGRRVPWLEGVPKSTEQRGKISAALKGRKRSEETRRKISEGHQGLHPSEETIRKLRESNLGQKRSDEFKKKMSEIAKARHWPQEYRDRMSSIKRGTCTAEKSSNWKGGRVKRADGYIMVHRPGHPFCNCRKYVFEHRLVIEKQIGRYLDPREQVHHLNKNKGDNRPQNLIAFKNQAAHNSFEAGRAVAAERIVYDGRVGHIISTGP